MLSLDDLRDEPKCWSIVEERIHDVISQGGTGLPAVMRLARLLGFSESETRFKLAKLLTGRGDLKQAMEIFELVPTVIQ